MNQKLRFPELEFTMTFWVMYGEEHKATLQYFPKTQSILASRADVPLNARDYILLPAKDGSMKPAFTWLHANFDGEFHLHLRPIEITS